MKKNFPAVCRHCGLKIVWNEQHREWDRVTPNKTFDDKREQLNRCVQSPQKTWHDPNKQYSFL